MHGSFRTNLSEQVHRIQPPAREDVLLPRWRPSLDRAKDDRISRSRHADQKPGCAAELTREPHNAATTAC